MSGNRTIAIVGCGIGGLAAASLLSAPGRTITIFDQFLSPGPVGSGLVIQPVGQDVLRRIGAYDAARTMGAPIYEMIGHEADHNKKVLDVRYGVEGGPSFGLGIHRASLFEALFDAAKARKPNFETGRTIERSENMADGRYLICADGKRFGPFDLVIDAAGAGSPLSPLKGQALSFGALWGTVDWPKDTPIPKHKLSQIYRRADKMIGALPIGYMPGGVSPKAAIFWSLPREDYKKWKDAPLQDWKDEVTALWPDYAPFLSGVKSHDDMTFSQYSHGTLSRPYAERLVHIGDAAHRASPQLGQGANMALLDAAALAHALNLLPFDHALKKYARSRRLHTGIYQLMSWAFTPMYQSQNRILPVIRDHMLAPFSVMPMIRPILTRLVCGNLTRPYAGFYSES